MLLYVILFIVGATVLAIATYYMSSKSKYLRIGVQALLLLIIAVLVISLRNGIQEPITFKEKSTIRLKACVKELRDIRNAQEAYNSVYGKYTSSFDTLIKFIKTDSLIVTRREGEVPDSTFLKAKNVMKDAIRMAIAEGSLKIDTFRVSTLDSLFKGKEINNLGIIPFSNNKKFDMDTATVDAGGVKINVFEAKASYGIILEGLNEQLRKNLSQSVIDIDPNRFPGLKVGSIKENNNNQGNWSKDLEIE